MTAKALDDTVDFVKTVALSVIRARQAGKSCASALESAEVLAAVAAEAAELPKVAAEAMTLGVTDEIELAGRLFNAMCDVVRALRANPGPQEPPAA